MDLFSMLIFLAFFLKFTASIRPNILLIVADDLGPHDVSYNGSPIPTPAIDQLATDGVILENYYTHPVCTPSRAALMTGQYAHVNGLPGPTLGFSPCALPKNTSTLAEELKDRGYHTHLVGKWHLGQAKWSETPRQRGFDTFYGMYGAAVAHYSKITWETYDFHRNEDCEFGCHKHSNIHLAEETIKIVQNHAQNKDKEPWFIYLAFLAAHGPPSGEPHHLEMCNHIPNAMRRKFCAMVIGMDEAIKNITTTLKELDMFENTVIAFTTDNGAAPHDGGSTFPYRGAKFTGFEGGARGPAFLHASKYLKKNNFKYQGLMHISDWFPSLLHLVDRETPLEEGKVRKLRGEKKLDGYNLWESISNNAISPREDVVLTLDTFIGLYGYRYKNWKLIFGQDADDAWYGEPTSNMWMTSPTPIDVFYQYVYHFIQWLKGEAKGYSWTQYFNHARPHWKHYLGIQSGPKSGWSTSGISNNTTYLFDLSTDPLETTNLYAQRPDIVAEVMAHFNKHRENIPQQCDWRLMDPEGRKQGRYDSTGTQQCAGPWLSEDVDISQIRLLNVLALYKIRVQAFFAVIVIAVLIVIFIIKKCRKRNTTTNKAKTS